MAMKTGNGPVICYFSINRPLMI